MALALINLPLCANRDLRFREGAMAALPPLYTGLPTDKPQLGLSILKIPFIQHLASPRVPERKRELS